VPIPAPAPTVPLKIVTITNLIDRFMEWADVYYRHPSGEPTREAENFRHVTRPLRKMFGHLPVSDFGSIRLLALRQRWVKQKLARRTINAMTRRVRQIFRWGVSRELVPIEVLQGLQTVEPLQPNRGGKETTGSRGSVPFEVVQQTLPHLPPLIRSLVLVAFHSGPRIGELAKLTTGMIDTTTDPWIAILDQHKTSHKSKSRRLYFGPKAQSALQPFLLQDQPDEPIFSPLRVDARQQKRRGKRLPGRFYGRSSLQQVLRRAIDWAGVEHWSLGQLRHSAAVRITDECGLETTRQLLGHATISMSSHYSRGSEAAAKKAAKEIG
jgi:integrase